MQRQGFVSLWIGTTKSEKDLNDFLKITYNEDGDYVRPPFAKGFGIRRFDDDFREAKYYEKSLNNLDEISTEFSYFNIIMPKFKQIINKDFLQHFNAVIFLYNFEYEGSEKHYSDGINSFNYIGTVEYK